MRGLPSSWTEEDEEVVVEEEAELGMSCVGLLTLGMPIGGSDAILCCAA